MNDNDILADFDIKANHIIENLEAVIESFKEVMARGVQTLKKNPLPND